MLKARACIFSAVHMVALRSATLRCGAAMIGFLHELIPHCRVPPSLADPTLIITRKNAADNVTNAPPPCNQSIALVSCLLGLAFHVEPLSKARRTIGRGLQVWVAHTATRTTSLIWDEDTGANRASVDREKRHFGLRRALPRRRFKQ